jgi:ATP-dependent Clp protease ATP-binding subunit ClpA
LASKSEGSVFERFAVESRHVVVLAQEEPTEHMIPFTPRCKAVLELSLREAQELGQRSIETEHVLLGLLREPKVSQVGSAR